MHPLPITDLHLLNALHEYILLSIWYIFKTFH